MQNEAGRGTRDLAGKKPGSEVSQGQLFRPPAEVVQIAQVERELEERKGCNRYFQQGPIRRQPPAICLNRTEPVLKFAKQSLALGAFCGFHRRSPEVIPPGDRSQIGRQRRGVVQVTLTLEELEQVGGPAVARPSEADRLLARHLGQCILGANHFRLESSQTEPMQPRLMLER